MKSDPQLLSHKDYLTFGTTTLRIHIHGGDQTCDECEPGQVQALFRQQKSMEGMCVMHRIEHGKLWIAHIRYTNCIMMAVALCAVLGYSLTDGKSDIVYCSVFS